MNKEDIENIENAIIKQYGRETVIDPKENWNSEKEEQYLQEIKELYQKEAYKEFVDLNGVLISKDLFKDNTKDNVCISCKKFSFNKQDDLYMIKYKCCFKCYISFVEDREEKWLKKISENSSNK